MTKRSSSRRTSSRRARRHPRGLRLTRAHWSGIGGLVLLAAALFTLVSLVAPDRGAALRTWLGVLRAALGWGAYLAPIGFGALGLWSLTRASARPVTPAGSRVLGAVLLFLTALTLTHHVGGATALGGHGGGALGRLLSEALLRWLGWGGGAVVLITLAGIALILALEISWAEVIADVGRLALLLIAGVRARLAALRRRRAVRASAPIQAPLPVPDAVPPAPAPQPQAAAPAPAPTAPPSPVPPTSPAEDYVTDTLAGHSVRWQVPRLEDVLIEHAEAEMNIGDIREKTRIIEETLRSLGVPVTVVEVNPGPVVTQFGLEPGYVERRDRQGNVKRAKIKVSRIQALSNDLALALAASPIRIEAPVPGKAVVGLEVPNAESMVVGLRSVIESEPFQAVAASPLAVALGRDVSGTAVVSDLAKLPHLLIAGATGSGKSVCINALVACLLCRCTPDALRLLMIDPKRVELSAFNGIPHLLAPVVVEVDRVVGVLKWLTHEMDRRYRVFAQVDARHLEAYNAKAVARNEPTMPLIVCFIDELADLMMAAPDEVERSICRIAQMARATGIHLVIATQRPSVDVVTGLIKANFPARVAFAVSSQTDSRVILDAPGADRLLGRGDALFMSPASAQLLRLQGCYVSDAELAAIVSFWRAQNPTPAGVGVPPGAVTAGTPLVQQPLWAGAAGVTPLDAPDADEDPLLEEAMALVTAEQRASVSFLQRRLRIGYSRAARLLDTLEQRGFVTPADGARPREVLAAPPSDGANDTAAGIGTTGALP